MKELMEQVYETYKNSGSALVNYVDDNNVIHHNIIIQKGTDEITKIKSKNKNLIVSVGNDCKIESWDDINHLIVDVLGSEWARNYKMIRGLSIGIGVLSGAGLFYGGYKLLKHIKKKKAEKEAVKLVNDFIDDEIDEEFFED